MRVLTLTLTGLFLCTQLAAAANARGGKAMHGKQLTSPEWVYDAMSEAFPDFREHIGGFSYEFTLRELRCSASNSRESDETMVAVSCTAVNSDGKSQKFDDASDLFLRLVNAGAVIDRKSEAGTSYIALKNVSCGVIEPKSTSPDDPITPEYFCSAAK